MKFTQLPGERIMIRIENQGSFGRFLSLGGNGAGQRDYVERAAADERQEPKGPTDEHVGDDRRGAFAGAGWVGVDVSGEQNAHREDY